MVRTIVTLDDADKRWLDRYSSRNGKAAAQIIRQAIKEFQKNVQTDEYKKSVESSSGLFKEKAEDSVKFVRRIRDEWQDAG